VLDPDVVEQVTAFLIALPAPVDHLVLCRHGVDLSEDLAAGLARSETATGGSIVLVEDNAGQSEWIGWRPLEPAPVRINRIVVDRVGDASTSDRVTALAVALMADSAINRLTYHLDVR
jgi:hypothetical protein